MKICYIKVTASALLFISVFFYSCSSTNRLTIRVTEPAPVYVPTEIKSIGIIDRSLPSKKNVNLDKLDKILSVEGKDLDKNGAHTSVIGLFDELTNSDRFSEVKIIDDVNLRSPGFGVLPSALSWEVIERICRENNVDAIFALSFYDTEARISYQTAPIEVVGALGIKITAIEHHATITTLIKTGWRIYDPINKFIQDEYLVNKNVVSKGVGINPIKALEAIMERKEAVLQESNTIGHDYAYRIFPYYQRVSRNYYVRGTDNFEIAKRRAQTNNWDGAAELWNKEVTNHKRKIAGRACYNMAIISEINGDYDAAIEWASKSYTDYKDKMALDYLNILRRRIRKNEQLRQEIE